MAEYSLFNETPAIAPNADSAVSLGIAFRVDTECELVAVRHLQPTSGSTAARTMAVYLLGGGAPVAGPYTMPTPVAGEWCTYTLPAPVTLPAEQYRIVVFHPSGDYPATAAYFTTGPGSTDTVFGPLTRLAAGITENGTYAYGPSIQYPSSNGNGGNYWADIVVADAAAVPSVTVTLTGEGSLAGTLTPHQSLTASMSGEGTLTGTAEQPQQLTAALSGAGTLTATLTPRMAVTVDLAGAGTLSGALAVVLGNTIVRGDGVTLTAWTLQGSTLVPLHPNFRDQS